MFCLARPQLPGGGLKSSNKVIVFGCGYAMCVINWQFVQRARGWERSRDGSSGFWIKQALDETLKEIGLSSLKSKQTEAIFAVMAGKYTLPTGYGKSAHATLVTHDCYAVART